jgi:hypothetical protein
VEAIVVSDSVFQWNGHNGYRGYDQFSYSGLFLAWLRALMVRAHHLFTQRSLHADLDRILRGHVGRFQLIQDLKDYLPNTFGSGTLLESICGANNLPEGTRH